MPQPITWTIPVALAQSAGLSPESEDANKQPAPGANSSANGGGDSSSAGNANASNGSKAPANNQAGGANNAAQANPQAQQTQQGPQAQGQSSGPGPNQGEGKTIEGQSPANDQTGKKDAKENGAGGLFGMGGGSTMLILILFFIVLWIFLMGGQRKEKKKRGEMLASLEKGSRVQTVGGILGTIVELRDDEIILKVDENTNARMRFSRSAIQSVRDEEQTGGGTSEG